MEDRNKIPPMPLFPEKLPQEKERLRSLGDLLVDVSTLIEALNTYHQADQIDHVLTFPILPYSPVHIPEVFSLQSPDYITITAGKTKIDQSENNQETGQSTIQTYVSIDIFAGNNILKISRESGIADDESDDLIFDVTQRNPSRALRDELRAESEATFMQRINNVNKVPKSEINNLLISLAIPESVDFSSFAEKDLLEINTFTYLIEALQTKALETYTTGVYLFQKSDTELSFQKKDGDELFTIGYVDPKTNHAIIASVDTSTGFDLKFSIYSDGTIHYINPTNEEIAFLHSLVKAELDSIMTIPENLGDYSLEESGDPEAIAVEHVEKRNAHAHEQFNDEISRMLNQDGFDTPDSGTA